MLITGLSTDILPGVFLFFVNRHLAELASGLVEKCTAVNRPTSRPETGRPRLINLKKQYYYPSTSFILCNILEVAVELRRDGIFNIMTARRSSRSTLLVAALMSHVKRSSG
jgi:hypothetical protein